MLTRWRVAANLDDHDGRPLVEALPDVVVEAVDVDRQQLERSRKLRALDDGLQ
jgi:hypothetical protein